MSEMAVNVLRIFDWFCLGDKVIVTKSVETCSTLRQSKMSKAYQTEGAHVITKTDKWKWKCHQIISTDLYVNKSIGLSDHPRITTRNENENENEYHLFENAPKLTLIRCGSNGSKSINCNLTVGKLTSLTFASIVSHGIDNMCWMNGSHPARKFTFQFVFAEWRINCVSSTACRWSITAH